MDMTVDPCVLICQDGTNIRQAARAFFALAQLNYSTPSKAHRLAQPLREVDAILEDCQMRNMRGIR
jgi:DNA-binding NtrC family response regulator